MSNPAIANQVNLIPKAPDGKSVTDSSSIVIPKNALRGTARCTNDSAVTIYLSEGAFPAEVGKGHRLNANGGFYEIGTTNHHKEEVRAIAATPGAHNLCVAESDKRTFT